MLISSAMTDQFALIGTRLFGGPFGSGGAGAGLTGQERLYYRRCQAMCGNLRRGWRQTAETACERIDRCRY